MALSLNELNQLTPGEFQQRFINVVEDYPEAAIAVSASLPFKDVDEVVDAFNKFLDELPKEKQIETLRRYPDLGRPESKEISQESKYEHDAARLDKFEEYDIETFNKMKDAYKKKFGFPFVICVRLKTREAIVRALPDRLENSVEDELANGIGEVKKIAEIRIRDLVK